MDVVNIRMPRYSVDFVLNRHKESLASPLPQEARERIHRVIVLRVIYCNDRNHFSC